MSLNPTITNDVQSIAPWVDQLIQGWSYPAREKDWFRERIVDVPQNAACAGAFVANLVELLPSPKRMPMLHALRFAEAPNRFGVEPLNQFLLTVVHIAHELGGTGEFAADMETVQKAISRGFGAALIRATLPGFEGMRRLGEILRLTARALSGKMFSETVVDVQRRDESFVVIHRNEFNFLAHFHYATAYHQICGAEYGPARGASFKWTGVDEATITIHAR